MTFCTTVGFYCQHMGGIIDMKREELIYAYI